MNFPGQALRFGGVGAGASAVHLGVVSALVPLGLPVLLANAAAFAVAFQVSYYGHRSLTFRTSGGRRSYGKMLAVSLVAFAANEAAYSALLASTGLDYRLALVPVLLSVAAATFAATRCWVFRPGAGVARFETGNRDRSDRH